MTIDIRIIHAHDFVKVTPDGELNFELSKKMLIEIVSALAHLPDYEILIDSRNAESQMSITDLWYLAVEVSNFREAYSRKTAVLCPVKRFDSVEFFALCSQNQGLRIKGFTSFENAIEWLTGIENETAAAVLKSKKEK